MRMSCFLVQKYTHTSQKSRVFPFTFHLFLLLEALQSFVRLLEVLEVFGMVWKALWDLGGFVRLWAVLRGVERLWEALGGFIDFGWLCHALGGFGFGRLWEAFEKPWGALGGCGLSIACPHRGSGRLWEVLGASGKFWERLGGSGRL